MNINLIVFLVIVCLAFSIYIFYNIFKRKITLQHSLMWFMYMLFMILATISPSVVGYLAKALGFEVTSNMVFFFGFIILLFISFTLTKIISIQKEKITILSQEIGILKKEFENHGKN